MYYGLIKSNIIFHSVRYIIYNYFANMSILQLISYTYDKNTYFVSFVLHYDLDLYNEGLTKCGL